MVFVLYSVNTLYYIDWFSDDKPTLNSWDKSYLVMLYNLLHMFLDLVCWYFVEDFCTCIDL